MAAFYGCPLNCLSVLPNETALFLTSYGEAFNPDGASQRCHYLCGPLGSGSGPIDFDNPADVAQHDKMVTLVEWMLDLHKQKAGATNPNTLKQLETQITATGRQIDRLVYQLYELTDEEIALVEQGG